MYNNALQGYQANLAGYGAQLQGQQQAFNQEFAPAQLGESATQNLNQVGTQQGANISSLLNTQGNAYAAGTIGSANQITGGVNALTGGISNALNLNQLLSMLGGSSGGGVSNGSSMMGYQPTNLSSLINTNLPTVGAAPYVGAAPGSGPG